MTSDDSLTTVSEMPPVMHTFASELFWWCAGQWKNAQSKYSIHSLIKATTMVLVCSMSACSLFWTVRSHTESGGWSHYWIIACWQCLVSSCSIPRVAGYSVIIGKKLKLDTANVACLTSLAFYNLYSLSFCNCILSVVRLLVSSARGVFVENHHDRSGRFRRSKLSLLVSPPDDPIFHFTITDWINPPVFVSDLPETTTESNIRTMAEWEYCNLSTPTAWHCLLIGPSVRPS